MSVSKVNGKIEFAFYFSANNSASDDSAKRRFHLRSPSRRGASRLNTDLQWHHWSVRPEDNPSIKNMNIEFCPFDDMRSQLPTGLGKGNKAHSTHVIAILHGTIEDICDKKSLHNALEWLYKLRRYELRVTSTLFDGGNQGESKDKDKDNWYVGPLKDYLFWDDRKETYNFLLSLSLNDKDQRLELSDDSESELTQYESYKPEGGVIAALGNVFAHRLSPRQQYRRLYGELNFVDRYGFDAREQWAFYLSECPPFKEKSKCFEQRDTLRSVHNDCFDIAGRTSYVGRYATVIVDSRPLNDQKLQPDLLYDYLHRHAATVLLLGTYQRIRLYELSAKLVEGREGRRENIHELLEEVHNFRKVYWWENLFPHPASQILSKYQSFFNLDGLVEQLAHEASEYTSRVESDSSRRLNILLPILTFASAIAAVVELFFVFNYHRSPIHIHGEVLPGLISGTIALLAVVIIWWLVWLWHNKWRH